MAKVVLELIRRLVPLRPNVRSLAQIRELSPDSPMRPNQSLEPTLTGVKIHFE